MNIEGPVGAPACPTTFTTSTEKPAPAATEERIIIESRWPNCISAFNSEAFPGILLLVDGLPEPLRLNRAVLNSVSDLFFNGFTTDANSASIAWNFDTSRPLDRDALIKVLRFCYGEALNVTPPEVCAVYATLERLRLADHGESASQLESKAVEVAEHNLEAGIQMLKNSAMYSECCQSRGRESFLEKLARAVLTARNMSTHYDAVVHGCLMSLPPVALSKAEYGAPHTVQSEFAVRMLYVQQHAAELSREQQKELLLAVKRTELSSDEVERLRGTGLFSSEELVELLLAVLKRQEEQQAAERRETQQQLEYMEHAHKNGAGLTEQQLEALRKLRTVASMETFVEAAHSSTRGGGAVCDDQRKLIVSTCADSNNGRDVLVTRLSTTKKGSATIETLSVPFATASHTPVHDGTKFVYFMEGSTVNEPGSRFGRLDLDSGAFEELLPLPDSAFGNTFGGCWHCGCVYAVDAEMKLCCFNTTTREWRRLGVTVPAKSTCADVRLLSNPHDPEHLYVFQGRLYKISLVAHTVVRVTDAPEDYDYLRDVLLLGMEDTTALVLVVALRSGTWYMYSSHENQWTKLEYWRPTRSTDDHQYLVHMPSWNMLYYHVSGELAWEGVKLPE